MKILLIPPKNNYPDPRPSLDVFGQGFPYLAGALKEAGHEVLGVNLNPKWCQGSASLTLANMLNKALRESQPQLVGVGGLSADYSFVRDAIRTIRQINSNIPIVLGGGIVTYDHEFIFPNLRPDFAVRGEGEETLVALVKAMEQKAEFGSIANIAYWENGNPVYSPIYDPQTKLENLPRPDYSPFDFDEYLKGLNQGDNIFAYTRHHPRVMPISLGRSCPFKCTFCCPRQASKYRQRSIDHALEEIVYFYQKYQFNLLFIYDELFSLRQERLREFSAKIKKLKDDRQMDFDWTCALRVTQIDKGTLDEMKEAGCIFVGYGLESASPKVLESMKKGITVPQMERAIRITQEAGIGVQGNFILGDIAETPETMQETLDFFHRWCTSLFVHLAALTPYPGSDVFQYCLDRGIIKDKQSYYDQVGQIGKLRVNMTTMPDPVFWDLMNKTLSITDPSIHTLLGLKEAALLSCARIDQKFEENAPSALRRSLFEFRVICPHCGGNIGYLFPIRKAPAQPQWIRTCCARCHKRFRIKVPERLGAVDSFPRAQRLSSRKEGSKPFSLPAPFRLGDFTTAGLREDSSEWEKYAALGLVGKTEEALEGLKRFDHPEALFYTAVTHWMEEDETAAIRILEKISTPHARNLLALLRKPQIQVLAQLPYTRRAPHDLLTAAAQDKKFKVQNISFHPQDLPNEPYADIHKFFSLQRPPDFYICQMVEWHLIPPNLQQLPCPIFGATADYDLHIQAVYPWLQLFDELIVTDHTEWEDVSRLVRVPVSVFPKSFGIPDNLPPITSSPRVLDVFLSGSLNHPYFAEKALLLNQLLGMKGIRARFIDGFLLNGFYYSTLGNSKVSFTHIRHPGSMPTRGLEALSMGCAVAVQKGSVLTLYAGEEEGVLTYDFEAHNLVPAIRRILDDWPEFEKRARRGAEIIRREFSLPRVASQYLRFLTYLAAKPRNQREIKTSIQLDQKRMVLWKGWVPAPQPVFSKIRKQNLDRWQTRVKSEKNPRLFIDMARELVLEYAAVAVGIHTVTDKRQLLDRAFQLYRTAKDEFPDSLVLRFNLIRTALHFGRPKDRAAALKLAGETLNKPKEIWQVDPLDDVFPWDFFSTFFNYRGYFDRVTEHFTRGAEVKNSLIGLIRASLHYYLGHYSESLEDLKKATELDPEFAFYRFSYAEHLLKRGRSEDYRTAGDLLCQLAENSVLFEEAFRLLEKLHSQQLYICPQFEDLARKTDQAERSIRLVDPRNYSSFLKPKGRALELSPAGSKMEDSPMPSAKEGFADHQNHFVPIPIKECLVSALVPTYNAGRFMRGLLEDLEAQTMADRMEIVIVDTGSPTDEKEIVEQFQKKYDNIVYIRTEHRESSHSAINRCIRAARGKYVTLACTDDRHKEDALERMVAVLESRPDVALVYGNSHITVFENETFDNFTPGGTYRWADFDPQLLLQGCFAGPQPMWRRSLHGKYGYLDENLESAGDWEFWLRLVEKETFLRIDEFLGLYLYSPTSSEHKNPELSRKEAEIVRQRYIHREPLLAERKKRAERHQLADSGTLVLALRGTGTDEELSSLVDQVRNQPSAQGEPSVKVVRVHGGIPENGLGVTVSPPTPTVLQALHQGVDWEARYVLLLSADVTLPPALLDRFITIAESDPSIAAVGPVSNEAPDPQKVGQFLADEEGTEDLAGRLASRYGKDWKEVPYLGTFCLLLKSDTVRKAGGIREKLSVPVAMGQLFGRLRSRGFKAVCGPGIYVPHRELTPEEGKKFIDLQAAEEELREAERKYEEGALKEAEETFRMVLRDFPDHPEAYNDLACLLWQTGRQEEALKNLLKVMIIVPDHRDIIWNLGQFFKEMGRDREAFQVYRNYSALHPEEQEMAEIMNQWAVAAKGGPRQGPVDPGVHIPA